MTLRRLEAVLDDPGVAEQITAVEQSLPVGVRPRQLRIRTLLLGILLALADGRPAHLTRVHRALLALEEADRWRLGILLRLRGRPHLLSYRQIERTFSLLRQALEGPLPGGTPSASLGAVLDALTEASVETPYKAASTSLAADWTDIESFARAPLSPGAPSVDPEASWGHRRGHHPGQRDESFFGYYLSLATMVRDEEGPEGPELVRRMLLSSCHIDPVPAFVGVFAHMADAGVQLGDVLADSGYAHRVPENWALRLRAAGARIVTDLHPQDRGPQGTFAGAVICNGSLYCPATPTALLGLGPPARDASGAQLEDHDQRTAEADRYRLGKVSSEDRDGYHRVMCPALLGKLRCPLRRGSMALSYDHPEVTAVPERAPACCRQKTVTVPPTVAAKTAQKHPYPSAAWRRSYARRTSVERSNSRIKDPATIDVARGWCRVMGLVPMSLFLACALVVRNLAVADAFEARQAEGARRRAAGLEPRRRRKRRKTLDDLVAVGTAP